MSIISSILDIQKRIQGVKKYREEKERRERWDPMLEKSQQLENAARQIEIEKARRVEGMWAPERKEYAAPGHPVYEPEGEYAKQLRLSNLLREQMIGGYRTPEQEMELRIKEVEEKRARGLELSPEDEMLIDINKARKMKELGEEFREFDETVNVFGIEIPLYKYDPTTGGYVRRTTDELENIAKTQISGEYAQRLKEINAGMEREETAEEGAFDEQGQFDQMIFFDIVKNLPEYAGYRFYDLVDSGEIQKAKEKILRIAISTYGDTPETRAEIERALDEWMVNIYGAPEIPETRGERPPFPGTQRWEKLIRDPEAFEEFKESPIKTIITGVKEKVVEPIAERVQKGKNAPELITPGPTTQAVAEEDLNKKLKRLGKKALERMKFWK